MSNARAHEMAKKLTQSGGPFSYGRDLSRLLIQVVRALAKGRAVTGEQVEQMAEDLGLAPDEANEFLRRRAERDANDDIVGLMGLSLNDHPHRFSLNETRMSTWCAEDTLFLPAVLQQTATVESESPLSKETVRLTIGPDGVQEVNPSSAVVSIPILEPDKADMTSAPAIWGNFCHHVFFFASRKEAEEWAGGRDDIEILSVNEGYEFGQELCSKVLAHV